MREYADRFLVHWDKIDPSGDPIGHLVQDAPHWIVIGALTGFFRIVSSHTLFSEDFFHFAPLLCLVSISIL